MEPNNDMNRPDGLIYAHVITNTGRAGAARQVRRQGIDNARDTLRAPELLSRDERLAAAIALCLVRSTSIGLGVLPYGHFLFVCGKFLGQRSLVGNDARRPDLTSR